MTDHGGWKTPLVVRLLSDEHDERRWYVDSGAGAQEYRIWEEEGRYQCWRIINENEGGAILGEEWQDTLDAALRVIQQDVAGMTKGTL
jgi:hypothetical protein